MVKEAIMSVLRLAVEFSERWRKGVEKFKVPEAEKIEVEFSHCSHFLVSCLNNVTKRGHFPHCEYTMPVDRRFCTARNNIGPYS